MQNLAMTAKCDSTQSCNDFSHSSLRGSETTEAIQKNNPHKVRSHQYQIKTIYKIFGIYLFSTIKIANNPNFSLVLAWREVDFCNIGKYISLDKNIAQKIGILCKDLNISNKIWLTRQISRAKLAFESGKDISDLSYEEICDLEAICTEFYPNIFKISDDLYAYSGYLVPQEICAAEVFWYKHNLHIFTPQTLSRIKMQNIIDVGASIGDSAIVFEREFCDKNIYSFEPLKARYELMLQTIKLNSSKRIIPINKGLGAESACVAIDSDIASMVAIKDAQFAEIITLDSFVEENNIKVGFIKVDVEGFEMEFLKGAMKTITSQKPAMLISIYHSGSDYFHIKPFIDSLNLGYTFKIYKGTDWTITEETGLFCEAL